MTEILHLQLLCLLLFSVKQDSQLACINLLRYREESECGYLSALADTDHVLVVWQKNVCKAFFIHVHIC